MVHFDLDEAIEEIAGNLGTTYTKSTRSDYSKEYLLPDVDSDDLLTLGFEYKGLTEYTEYPYYEWENLIAIYEDSILHICQLED